MSEENEEKNKEDQYSYPSKKYILIQKKISMSKQI